MSAKWMKAVNITSSLSKREKILLKPLTCPQEWYHLLS